MGVSSLIAMGNDPFIDGLPIKNGDFDKSHLGLSENVGLIFPMK